MNTVFNLQYYTQFGERLFIRINEIQKGEQYELPMQFGGNNYWYAEADITSKNIEYQYFLKNDGRVVLREELSKHKLDLDINFDEVAINDVWNEKSFPENYLNNKILHNQIGKKKFRSFSVKKKATHVFRLEVPVYHQNQKILLFGNCEGLGNWDADKAIKLEQSDYAVWETSVDLSKTNHQIEYKYAIQNTETGEITFELGNNRVTPSNKEKGKLLLQNDHNFNFPEHLKWHAAGVAVPVFALRTRSGFGVGEFSDIKLLADWALEAKMSIIQILPINDTTANYTWTDSYPYAAISVYALHPQYLSIENLKYALPKNLQEEYEKEKETLNSFALIDYEKMIAGKWKYISAIFKANKNKILKDKQFLEFLEENASWLKPYAVFCVLRDKYKTPDFNKWKTLSRYSEKKVEGYFSESNKDYDKAILHAWVQYQLDAQLTQAIEYTHSKGISIKGDLPIGIYRFSVDAWTDPELYGMNFQAGAPPDEFTQLGQNWEFPTYNWEKMKEDGYQWWKNRFQALAKYFDAMRIDHILGFFRIWRMPMSAVQGILGYFYPAIPVTYEEFNVRGIYFDENRYCKPYITEQILWDTFGYDKEKVEQQFFYPEYGRLFFKPEFDTQRKIADYFKKNPDKYLEEKLLLLAANVLFLIQESEQGLVFHPRFNLYNTISYQHLSDIEKGKLYDLYIDYFFKRQDHLWKQSAMEKLPPLLSCTDMLICGEDLGLIPECVPEVMEELGIAALKVQRSPKENVMYYNPKDAGYMNVVTVSSHDSSTLRQWWHEDRGLTQNYFNNQLGQWGEAPEKLTPELLEIILQQHLYNNAMLAIFPIQEFLATDHQLANPNIDDERINVPAIFPHYWRYRLHINLEDLTKDYEFGNKIANWIIESGRS